MTKKEKKKDKDKEKAGGSSKQQQQTLPEPLETQRHYVICGPDQNSHVSGVGYSGIQLGGQEKGTGAADWGM